MEAIILAGGKGTRLYPLTKTVPKPMVPVADKPFLEHLMLMIIKEGVTHIILSIGYLGEQIQNHFGECWQDIKISYVHEDEPLGTGGAIVAALNKAKKKEVFVINGDTYCEFNYKEVVEFHKNNKADFTQVLKLMLNFDRYGTVKLDSNKIISFEEKKFVEEGLINTGAYLLNKAVILDTTANLPTKFSFEDDFMQIELKKIKAFGYVSEGYFIDIGVPDDLEKAQIKFIKNTP